MHTFLQGDLVLSSSRLGAIELGGQISLFFFMDRGNPSVPISAKSASSLSLALVDAIVVGHSKPSTMGFETSLIGWKTDPDVLKFQHIDGKKLSKFNLVYNYKDYKLIVNLMSSSPCIDLSEDINRCIGCNIKAPHAGKNYVCYTCACINTLSEKTI